MSGTIFTAAELAYLSEQHLGRIATSSATGVPDVAPVTFRVDPETHEIVIGGMDNTKTIKYRNVIATGRAAFVVDDLVSVQPWSPRGVKVRGQARPDVDDNGSPTVRIRPTTIWSWHLNQDAEKRFGPIERREVGIR